MKRQVPLGVLSLESPNHLTVSHNVGPGATLLGFESQLLHLQIKQLKLLLDHPCAHNGEESVFKNITYVLCSPGSYNLIEEIEPKKLQRFNIDMRSYGP